MALFKILAQRNRRYITSIKVVLGLFAEPDDFQQEAIKCWAEQITALGEQAVEIRPGIDQPGLVTLEAEGHF